MIPALLVLIILIVPVSLSNESDFATSKAPQVRASNVPGTSEIKLQSKTLPKVNSQEFGSVEREIFISAFERQAARELVPCLNESVGVHGSLTFTARLHRKGRLSAVRIVSPTDARATCIVEAVNRMAFFAAGHSMNKDSLEVKWRFDF